jgi:hypothetical protein
MPYKLIIEDIGGRPIGGMVRLGAGGSFAQGSSAIPIDGKEFADAVIEGYDYIEVSSPGYYTVVMPVTDLYAITHIRLHKQPNLLAYAIGGAVGLGLIYWYFSEGKRKNFL